MSLLSIVQNSVVIPVINSIGLSLETFILYRNGYPKIDVLYSPYLRLLLALYALRMGYDNVIRYKKMKKEWFIMVFKFSFVYVDFAYDFA